jgi:putative PEP-CTERM system histidine kinase
LTASTFTVATTWSYGLALAGYAVFAARVAIGSRSNVRAQVLFAALAITALWAASCAAIAVAPGRWSTLAMSACDALRYGAWYLFLWHLLTVPNTSRAMSRATQLQFALVGTALIASVALAESPTLLGMLGASGARTVFLLRLGLAVYGLILVEQVVRRVPPQMRWAIKPLAIALSGVFGLELFLYADGALFGQLDSDIWASRGFANLLVIPLLAMASARNSDWTVDLHLSREAVFHSGALLVSGTFLLAVAIAGYFVRYFGGEWGHALQIELLFAAALLIALVASSGQFRSKLKVFVSKHFFSYRYDYRQEWLRFTHTLSSESAVQGLQERVVMALADLVESPGGLLWMKEDPRGYAISARWNVSRVDGVERADSTLVRFMERTGWIIDVAELRDHPERYADVDAPGWLAQVPSSWLIVPLISGSELQAFAVLAKPRAEIDVDWEVRDLLKTASRQAASYLGQVRATEALLEARKFEAFNRMSAFVVHDLKNLVAQLSLMLRNAQRHHGNPAFQADMLATVEHVVSRMNALMLQLRTGAEPVDKPHPVDLSAIVRNVCSSKTSARGEVVFEATGPLPAIGHEDRLEHVIGHLIQNAIDATESSGRVVIRTSNDGEYATVLVADDGVGMTEAFMRERLFKPFETTKPSGMGIGVYESSQYVTSLGGDITVDSNPGTGTLVRVRLPVAPAPEREALHDAEIKEQAA